MTRLQQQVSRKLKTVGCSSKYDSESKNLNISFGNQSICLLNSNDNFTYRADEHIGKDQKDAFFRVEKIINQAKNTFSTTTTLRSLRLKELRIT